MLFQVHLWVGLVAAVYVVVVCATGSVLVFRIQLQRAEFPHLFSTDNTTLLVDPTTILERLRVAYPERRVIGIDAPTTERTTYLAYVDQASVITAVLLDPVTADVLGEIPENGLVRTIQRLHFDLLLGNTGRLLNGIGSMCLLLLAATGLVIWWPGFTRWRQALGVDLSRNWKRITWDLHGAVGIWTVALIAMWAVTGVYFIFPAEARDIVSAVSPLSEAPIPQARFPADRRSPPTSRELVEVARGHVSEGMFVARVVPPTSERSPFVVSFSDASPTPSGATLRPVYLDPGTGDLLDARFSLTRSAGDVVMAWMAPLHVGNFGGTGVRVVWFVLGLAPLFLAATGCLLWWVRVVRPRLASGRVAQSTTEPQR